MQDIRFSSSPVGIARGEKGKVVLSSDTHIHKTVVNMVVLVVVSDCQVLFSPAFLCVGVC